MTRYVREDVAHVWAHKLLDHARNKTGNFYFHGDTIYSYGCHFPIARHVEHKGKKCILFTTRDYSSTTSGHKSEVLRAIPPGVLVFHVECPTNGVRKEMLDGYADRITQLCREVAKGREGFRQQCRLDSLVKLVEEANNFSRFFGLRRKFAAPTDMDEIKAQVKKEAELLRRRQAAERRKREAKQAEALESWLQGGDKWPHDLEFDHLRIRRPSIGESYGHDSPAEELVETTRHAYVPLRDVKKIAKLVLKHVNSGEHWQRNGDQISVGDYRLDAITSDGTVHVGCHKFKREEILRFAGVLGIE